jgi:hypothetical protein
MAGIYGNGATASSLYYEVPSGQSHFFGIADSTKMTLDSAGNLGLGVTPSAWQTTLGSRAIQFTGGSVFNYRDTNFILTQNAYFDGAFKYYASSIAAGYYDMESGTHKWFTAPSGTAGNTISFTQAMTLDASGNLGVGTTSLGSFRFKALGTGGNLSGNAYYVGLVGEGAASNKGVGLGYDSSSQTGIIYSETASAASNLAFWTYNGSAWGERARITSGGFFKASNSGTYLSSTASYHELFNNGAGGDWTARFTNSTTTAANAYGITINYTGATPNSTDNSFINATDSSANRFLLRSNGGIANYSANDANLSDRREKTNFAPAGSYLDKICAIPVQTFNYIDQNLETDAGLTLGVVAQDVQAVAPELVTESDWGTKDAEPKMRLSIYQTDLQYALMKCIQEQQAIIESLKARLDAANL